jgi:hypothetical protein
MMEEPYRVTVVVDPQFGTRLRDLPAGEPCWVVDSAENHPVIASLWQNLKTGDADGITSFKVDSGGTPEDWLISELGAIDLHHGEYSHNPPWSVLNAVGVPWSDRIARGLAQFGFTHHADTELGFEARRRN